MVKFSLHSDHLNSNSKGLEENTLCEEKLFKLFSKHGKSLENTEEMLRNKNVLPTAVFRNKAVHGVKIEENVIVSFTIFN